MSELDASTAPDAEARAGSASPSDWTTSPPTPARPIGTSEVRFGQGPVAAPSLTRRGRVRKWDRPPPPHDWRWYVGNLGKILISVGLLMFAFVGYQLYGTGIETAAAQNDLENEFEQLLAASDAATPALQPDDTTTVTVPITTDAAPTPGAPADPVVSEPIDPATVVPVEDQNLPSLEDGEALARIEIPRIGVDDIVVAGVNPSDLKRGPGHFPDTPLPGQLGNAAIAGHRTTYGQPFRNVDKLVVGDEIRVTTLNGVFVYRVTGQRIVSPSDYQVVATTDPTRANLTLTSCHPVFTARERIVIFSELDRTESAAVGEPVLNYGRPPEVVSADAAPSIPGDDEIVDDATGNATGEAGDDSSGEVTGALTDEPTPAFDQLGTDATNSGIADAFSVSWFSDPSANPQVGLWGVALAAVALASYAISRKLRRDWIGLAVGLLPFVVTLYFFFQNVNRLLPPNL